jgi:hypothetical protein
LSQRAIQISIASASVSGARAGVGAADGTEARDMGELMNLTVADLTLGDKLY